jgi:hypothetical protein
MDRSKQGITRPFICRADDGHTYFTKGLSAGRRSQICEWIAGQLAVHLELPIPPFRLVDVPEELFSIHTADNLQTELGTGFAFGSRKSNANELLISQISEIPLSVQHNVLAFDWWIRNGDRTLTAQGGNPNLFWDIETSSLVVIDHNLAFDADFSAQNFVQAHVFHGQWDAMVSDNPYQEKLKCKFGSAMENWKAICTTVPSEWWFSDAEQTMKTNFDLQAIYKILMRFQEPDFWRLA